MRVAFIGIRSVPGRYGGFETVATQLAPRLVKRGCDLTVYCQRRYTQPPRPATFEGVKLIHLPSLHRQALEETSHEAVSLAHALTRRYDLLYVFGMRATTLFAPIALTRKNVVFNTDGHDWQRRKWGPFARKYLLFSEKVGTRIAPDRLIADSKGIAAYFTDTYGVTPTYIPYGAPEVDPPDPSILSRFGLRPKEYMLVLCRLEPENNIDLIIRAFDRARPARELAIVGGVNYGNEYIERLRAMASDRVRFLGTVYDPDAVDALYHHSYAYLHGHEVGGTNPSLLHSMGAGACVLANDVVYNREVLGDAGLYWEPSIERLAELMTSLGDDPERAATLGREAQVRAKALYDWDAISDRYMEYFEALIKARRRERDRGQ